jgi:hypothetical protein
MTEKRVAQTTLLSGLRSNKRFWGDWNCRFVSPQRLRLIVTSCRLLIPPSPTQHRPISLVYTNGLTVHPFMVTTTFLLSLSCDSVAQVTSTWATPPCRIATAEHGPQTARRHHDVRRSAPSSSSPQTLERLPPTGQGKAYLPRPNA